VGGFPHCFADVWLEGKQKKRLVNVAEFSHYIDSNIVLELSEAPFSREDDTLHPEAGACLSCPKHSGFNMLLFPDMKKDSCFDPTCYGEKLTRFIATSNLVKLAGGHRPVPHGSPTVPPVEIDRRIQPGIKSKSEHLLRFLSFSLGFFLTKLRSCFLDFVE
jgi:hypothetical protein